MTWHGALESLKSIGNLAAQSATYAVRMAMPDEEAARAIIPMLICRDAASEIDFCKLAYEAVETLTPF